MTLPDGEYVAVTVPWQGPFATQLVKVTLPEAALVSYAEDIPPGAKFTSAPPNARTGTVPVIMVDGTTISTTCAPAATVPSHLDIMICEHVMGAEVR
jgi:hypothetical protein